MWITFLGIKLKKQLEANLKLIWIIIVILLNIIHTHIYIYNVNNWEIFTYLSILLITEFLVWFSIFCVLKYPYTNS